MKTDKSAAIVYCRGEDGVGFIGKHVKISVDFNFDRFRNLFSPLNRVNFLFDPY